MFKSIHNLGYAFSNQKDGKKYSKFRVIDDDFTEIILSPDADAGSEMGEEGFIKLYENKNFNVPKNLILLFIFLGKENDWTIQEQIEWNLMNVSYYNKYHNEVEKYLLLV